MSNSDNKVNANSNTKVVTGKIRMAYANLFTPRLIADGQDLKYSLCVLIPKSDTETISKVKVSIENAKKSGATLLGDIEEENFKTPLRDGDEERPDQTEYAAHYFLNAISKQKPGIVDKTLKEIVNAEEVYSGCYGRVSLNFYAFNQGGNKGIGCGLLNLQKLADGEELSVRSRAEDDFQIVNDEDDILG